MVIILGADALATQGARASTAMIFPMFIRNNSNNTLGVHGIFG